MKRGTLIVPWPHTNGIVNNKGIVDLFPRHGISGKGCFSEMTKQCLIEDRGVCGKGKRYGVGGKGEKTQKHDGDHSDESKNKSGFHHPMQLTELRAETQKNASLRRSPVFPVLPLQY